jgi:CDP-2,3-bis-(O-geranylgeranyl)-sn-glycerol synthase
MFISALYYRYWRANISIDSFLIALLSALWIMLPAYVPNSAAAVFGGGIPIDGGRTHRDGRRLLGDGKTWRGFILGVATGIVVGLLQIWVRQMAGWEALPALTVLVVILLATGALLGDLVKSYFKRRLGRERGAPWLIADQYDLVAGAFALVLIFDYPWFISTVTLPILVIILIITPILHKTVNVIGYLIRVKEVPW